MIGSPRAGVLVAVGWLAGGSLLLACATPLDTDQEQDLGLDAARALRKELDFVRDPWVVDYVDSLGRQLLAAAGPQPFDFQFYVVRDPALNAYALPAGYIYLNTGILLDAANVSELAGVLAHEIGHVALRHVAENYNRQRNTQLAYETASVLASVLVGGYAAAGGQLAGQLVVVTYLNQFSREDEQEADAFALEILPRAGYDPNGLLTFFETLQAQSGRAEVPVFLSSHPTTAARIEAAAASIAAAPLPGDLQVSDRGRLQIIQRRIELLGQERG